MLDRKLNLVVPLTLAILGGALAVAQETKVYRIGMLETVGPQLNTPNFDAFRQGLRELGYVEGRNLVIEYRSADGDPRRFPELAAQLVRLKVDVLVTRGTPATVAATDATATIPVVMAAIGQPVDNNLIASLARPGGNVTGLSALIGDLMPKRLELLGELVPGLTRVAALIDLSNPVAAGVWKELESAARSVGVQAQILDVRKADDIDRAFDAAARQRARALIVGNSAPAQANRRRIVDLAAKHRLPAMYSSREFVDVGGLLSYGVSYTALYRRAASYVDRILRGAKPGDLPVEEPSTFELVINRKAATTLGLSIPQPLLLRADYIVER